MESFYERCIFTLFMSHVDFLLTRFAVSSVVDVFNNFLQNRYIPTPGTKMLLITKILSLNFAITVYIPIPSLQSHL